MVEATVSSLQDSLQTRRLVLSPEEQTQPCCVYSETEDRLPCYHGVTVLCERNGAVNIVKFVARRHLAEAWKLQYANSDFNIPFQAELDTVLACAKQQVATDTNMGVPVALPTRCGIPVRNTGKRRRSWY